MSTLLALALSTAARAFVVDLNVDPRPIARVDGRTSVQVDLPTVVLAQRDSLRILGRPGGAFRSVGGWSCVVTMADGTGTLNESLDQCRFLYALPPGGHVDFVRQIPPAEPTVVRLAVAPADPGGSVIINNEGQLLLGGELGPVVAAAAWIEHRWYPVQIDALSRQVVLDLDAQTGLGAWMQTGTQDLVIRAEIEGAGREREWRAARVWSSQAEKLEAARLAEAEAAEWCEPGLQQGQGQRTVVVCIDAEGGPVRARRFEPGGAVLEDVGALPTGAFVEVAVRHPAGRTPAMALAAGEPPLATALPDAGPVPHQVSRRLFTLPQADQLAASATIDGTVVGAHGLDVVDRYLGALRLGMAVTTPASHRYTLGEENDAGTAPVERGSGDIIDAELITSFALFLDPQGRDYLLPADFRLAPMVGLGVLSANGSTVRFTLLQSWYLGAELELTPALAFGLGATLRSVKRLEADVDEGDLYAPDDDVPTRSVVRPGLGLSIGFTPDPLRFRR